MSAALRAPLLGLSLLLTGCIDLVIWTIPAELRLAAPPPLLGWMGCEAPEGASSFEEVFAQGEACGALLGAAAWSMDVGGLEAGWLSAWVDGVGHGLRAPPAELAEWALAVEALPAEHRLIAHEAALRAWTVSVAGEPEAVLPWVEAYGARVGGIELRNGVRTGLQEALGGDMAQAIAVALRYPADWQPALLEELGWRVGDRQLRGGDSLADHLTALPMPGRCAFVQGAARGLSMRLLSADHLRSGEGGAWSDVAALVAEGGEACRAAAWAGVGWAAVISVGRDTAAVRRALAGLPDAAGRRQAEATAAWASSGARLLWERPPVVRGRPL